MDIIVRHTPRLHGLMLRAALWAAAVGVVVAAAGIALDSAGHGSAIVAILLYLAIAVCVTTRVSAGHPHEVFGVANVLTLLRAGMICIIAGTLFAPAQGGNFAVAVAALAGLALALDGIDGWFARRSGLASTFGARFDMEIDSLFVLVLSLGAWMNDKAGVWVLAIGLTRYAFFSAGLFSKRMEAALPESLRRKAVCVVQIIALGILLLPQITPPLSGWIAASSMLVLFWSFAIDTRYLLTREEGV